MSNDDTIETKHLPGFIRQPQMPPPVAESTSKPSQPSASPNDFNLHQLETVAIRGALVQTEDNRTRAAELLGISRRTLQRKIKELGL
jgi:DNA-binding NtrC family response regulator